MAAARANTRTMSVDACSPARFADGFSGAASASPPEEIISADFCYTLNDVLHSPLSFPILASMAILVLCPQCGHSTEKLTALSQIARVDALYRCPQCSTICSEPS